MQPAWADADAPGHFAHSPRRAGQTRSAFQYGEQEGGIPGAQGRIEEQGHPALRGARLAVWTAPRTRSGVGWLRNGKKDLFHSCSAPRDAAFGKIAVDDKKGVRDGRQLRMRDAGRDERRAGGGKPAFRAADGDFQFTGDGQDKLRVGVPLVVAFPLVAQEKIDPDGHGPPAMDAEKDAPFSAKDCPAAHTAPYKPKTSGLTRPNLSGGASGRVRKPE